MPSKPNQLIQPMKLHLSLTTALCALSVCALAQRSITISLEPQITRGGAFYVPTDGTNNPTYIAADRPVTGGLTIGALLNFPISEKIHFATGLAYAKRGQRSYYEGSQPYGTLTDNFNITSNVALHYLHIPGHIIFQQTREKKTRLYLSGGIYIGMLLGYKHETTVEDNLSNGDSESATMTASGSSTMLQTMDTNGEVETYTYPFLEKPFRGIDLGISLGGGVAITVSEEISLPIGITLSQGMRNVKNQTSQYTDSNASDAVLYWKMFTTGSDLNKTASYRNSAVGLHVGLQILL